MIKIKDKYFVPLISQEEIHEQVSVLAGKINEEYAEKNPIVMGVLNGCFIFMSDLCKMLTINCEICFIRVSSYEKIQSSGQVKQIMGLKEDIANRHVILVEDIVDTGLTIRDIRQELLEKQPTSLKIATLLHKPTATKIEVPLDFVGFSIENKFVLGYGLDYDGIGRNSNEIYVLAE